MDKYILNFWNTQAEKYGSSFAASWGDLFAIRLEIETIGQFIQAGDHVLDVGCANGFSLLHHLEKNPASLTGVDFSEVMIGEAQKRQVDESVRFEVGDVRKLRFAGGTFDVVYTTRTLINLPTREEQQASILECVRVCKPGGKVILSEAFWEPLALLNALRLLKGLPPLVEHDFNRYLKKQLLEAFLASQGLAYEVVDFSSVYYLGTRFLRELVVDSRTGEDFTRAPFDNAFNERFFELEKDFSGGGFGIQQAYVVRKPGK